MRSYNSPRSGIVGAAHGGHTEAELNSPPPPRDESVFLIEHHQHGPSPECFNDWGGGGDTMIPSPEMTSKPPLLGIGLHGSLHDRQACPKVN